MADNCIHKKDPSPTIHLASTIQKAIEINQAIIASYNWSMHSFGRTNNKIYMHGNKVL